MMLAITFMFMTGFSMNEPTINPILNNVNTDINGDSTLNILVIGTNSSINGAEAFSPNQITEE